ncbi:MAG: ABC transporter ATP-binding protein [Gammaproteobacteria bacterium]|nr:ABC transporter ATP-binding protein [Gammaproteobacteria bacterium]
MSDNIALRVKNLSKCYQIYNNPQDRIKQAIVGGRKQYYREFWALRDIDFEVKKGEAFGIIGRNGSGKSTLLQLICKTLTPSTGEIETNGKIAALLELGAGFNPQFTGRENVYINGAILGLSKQEIDQRFDEILDFADIGNFIDQPVKSYSSGMFVRLAFAVQACVNPDILIIDEALAVGDVFFRQKCYKLLNQLLERGVSVILVTHGMTEVEQFCQRALLLDKGKAVFLGPANVAVKHYYLSGQNNDGAILQRQTETDTTDYEVAEIGDSSTNATEFTWPEDGNFLDISSVSQVNNGWAICTRVAVCDNQGNACQAFHQGDTASFFYEFKLLHDIEVPTTGIVIQNDKGINVHGKNTTEYGTLVPQMAKNGDILRVRHDVTLELAMGEYSFEIGLAMLKHEDYDKRKLYSYEELLAAYTRLCHLPNVSFFSVLPRVFANPVQLLHHGIANLPGHCQMVKLAPKILENAD